MREELDAGSYPMKSYTEYVGKDAAFWKSINTDEEYDWGSRVLLNKFLGCDGQPDCVTKQYFESHLKSIVQHIFNPTAMKKKTDGYKDRLSEEIKWDCGIQRLHTGTCAEEGCKLYKFTYDDFERGIEGPTETFPYGQNIESGSGGDNFSGEKTTTSNYDVSNFLNSNNLDSRSVMTKANIGKIILAVIFSVIFI
ncbi:hypothetical protein PIROE2DRAFT_63136 [Piromyces sp. E2]|nr:hypothetical protein PIROE2DRAFT_63136 [Piromyces sp. E2]|eukprot:OUM60435.1 hypothetical protein PIROE2DRAFT_63136 [Piromyces sp. E2]